MAIAFVMVDRSNHISVLPHTEANTTLINSINNTLQMLFFLAEGGLFRFSFASLSIALFMIFRSETSISKEVKTRLSMVLNKHISNCVFEYKNFVKIQAKSLRVSILKNIYR